MLNKGKSHGGVKAVISFHVSMLSSSMVGLSEGDAGHTARNGTCVDGHEAPKERLVPWASVGCGIASNNGRIS